MTALKDYLRSAKILIVDDEAANVRLVEYHLHSHGHRNFRSTTDSRTALELFREFSPDIVLLDLMMPHLNGFGVMAQIQDLLPPDAFLPVVILTADLDSNSRKRALTLGARDFLLKPFDVDELDLRIRNLLEARFLHLGLQYQNRQLESRVTERTLELEQALAELREAQKLVIHQQRLHAFAEMAGGVAHDFNNVLTVVMGYSGLLLEPNGLDDPKKARRDLRLIHRAADDARYVVERLRRFYRPRQSGDVYEPIEVATLVREAVELSRPKWKNLARGTGAEVDCSIHVEEGLQICGNAPELREMLLNLIFNSVDAMPGGGRLSLSAEAINEEVRLQVTDTGLGMTDEVKNRCMEPFFTTKGEKGTGLGLSMVFGILRRHEATVEIKSKVGMGTSFTISLPREMPREAGARVGASEPLARLRILFADDDENVRHLIPLLLESLGHEVTVAADGREALQIYGDGKAFDVVLTDLSMPRLNGEDLAKAVKLISHAQPVIVLTGFGDMLLKGGERPSCVDLLLSKPITCEGLNVALSQVVAAREIRPAIDLAGVS